MIVFPIEIVELILMRDGRISKDIMGINRYFNDKWVKFVAKLNNAIDIFPVTFDKFNMSNIIYWRRYEHDNRQLDVYQVIVLYNGKAQSIVNHTLSKTYFHEAGNWIECLDCRFDYHVARNCANTIVVDIPKIYVVDVYAIDGGSYDVISLGDITLDDIKVFTENDYVTDGFIFDRKAYQYTWEKFQTECSFDLYIYVLTTLGGALDVFNYVGKYGHSKFIDILRCNLSW